MHEMEGVREKIEIRVQHGRKILKKSMQKKQKVIEQIEIHQIIESNIVEMDNRNGR